MRIAIIGAGISGLTAAYRLCDRHELTLFEANDYLGGHTHTVDVDYDGERHAIDTGFIVYNERNYPQFCKLLDELGVESRPTSMSFSVRSDRTGLEYNGTSLNGLFAQRMNLLRPRFYQMLRDILRFNRTTQSFGANRGHEECDQTITVADFLSRGRYSREFAEHYLLPMGSAIWSCPTRRFAEFPLRFVVEFFQNHGLLQLKDRPQWRVIAGGSKTYVDALVRRMSRSVTIRLRTPIRSVRRLGERVEVTTREGRVESFDHVIFACHADQALRMLIEPTRAEREILCEFAYERNVALLHTDLSVLPRHRRAWASWNSLVPRAENAPATVTYCMNILQHLRSRHVFNVTLNGEQFVDPTRILGRFVYEHPVFTTRRDAAQARQHELLNEYRTSYCGAYWRNGFHEDGVVSALAVCSALNNAPSSSRLRAGAGSLEHANC